MGDQILTGTCIVILGLPPQVEVLGRRGAHCIGSGGGALQNNN